MIIIIVILLLLAAIVIPGLSRARMSSNEGAAIASLKSLACAQVTFYKQIYVDQDCDGSGEYGVFNEICGVSNLRGKNKKAKADEYINTKFAIYSGNCAHHSGYLYQIFLPGLKEPVTDNIGDVVPPQALKALSMDDLDECDVIQQQENRFICYAWPFAWRSSGVRAFVMDQSAEVYAAANCHEDGKRGYFFGTLPENRPKYNSAMMTLPETPTPTFWNNIAGRSEDRIDKNHFWLPTY
jgi:hypothetical protein